MKYAQHGAMSSRASSFLMRSRPRASPFLGASRRLTTASSLLPRRVALYEVGARDGLQNEATSLTTSQKLAFIDRLSRTGVSAVEAAAFVSPERVPQMAGASEIMRSLRPAPGVKYSALIPNLKGFEAAVDTGTLDRVCVLTAASETFSERNVNASIAGSTERALDVAAAAKARGIAVRGYISCCLGCPFEGEVDPTLVAELAKALYEGGCDEVMISDTIGTGTPGSMSKVLAATLQHLPLDSVGVHLHDTYGQALSNILTALQHGVYHVDSSAAGLGGCPFAGPGAAGNVATEDVVYMLNGMGIETGVDFDQVVEAGEYVCGLLGRSNASKAAQASIRRRASPSQPCSPTPPSGTLSFGAAFGATAASTPRSEEVRA